MKYGKFRMCITDESLFCYILGNQIENKCGMGRSEIVWACPVQLPKST